MGAIKLNILTYLVNSMAWSFNGTKVVLSFQVLNSASKVSESTVHLVLVEQFLRSSTKPAEFISYKTYINVRENRRSNKLWLMVVLSWYTDLLVIHTFFVYFAKWYFPYERTESDTEYCIIKLSNFDNVSAAGGNNIVEVL